jgi:hypothetical protein
MASGEKDLSAPGTYGPDDPGGGPFVESSGVREWYNLPTAKPATRQTRLDLTVRAVLTAWAAIELDLQDLGIDVESGVLDQRTWRWLWTRVLGLIANPHTRLHKALTKETPSGAST